MLRYLRLFPGILPVLLLQYHGEVAGALIEFRNMTLENKAEVVLNKSEEQFQTLADSLPQLVWTTTPSGEVEYYNQLWKDYTGYSKEHLG